MELILIELKKKKIKNHAFLKNDWTYFCQESNIITWIKGMIPIIQETFKHISWKVTVTDCWYLELSSLILLFSFSLNCRTPCLLFILIDNLYFPFQINLKVALHIRSKDNLTKILKPISFKDFDGTNISAQTRGFYGYPLPINKINNKCH